VWGTFGWALRKSGFADLVLFCACPSLVVSLNVGIMQCNTLCMVLDDMHLYAYAPYGIHTAVHVVVPA
jgi:hypothetical protein